MYVRFGKGRLPKSSDNLARLLRLVPARHRQDARQAAALARLEHRSPARAIDALRLRERRHERRERVLSQIALP